MALPDFTTQTASEYKANIDASIAEALTFSGVYCDTLGVTVNAPTSSFYTVPFSTENYDHGDYHDISVNNTRFIIPAGVSRARINASLSHNNSGGTLANLHLYIYKNGLTIHKKQVYPGSSVNPMSVSLVLPVIDVVPGDYFEMAVYHDYGSNLSIGNNSDTYMFIEAV